MYRGVYLVLLGPPSREAVLWAAVLYCGRGAVLSHQTAAELHGLIESPAETIYVTVPSTRRVRTPGIAIRISGRVGEARQPNREPPRTTVEETVLDLIQLSRTFDEACDAMVETSSRLFGSPEAQEGMRAFLERRAPAWAAPEAQ